MLSRAIRDGHVVVHYQPKVPFRPESRSYGVEALCRIDHPTLGMIYPDNFIPLAEVHDLIHELTDAVTVQAFRDLASWDRQGRSLRMALNVSPRLMASMAWFESFERRCQEFQVDPKRITLEVTESSSQGGKVLALEILSRLRLKGFLLSIDDFGTGFSSLETLYKLPFGELKIDKGFVFDLHKSSEARTLVESTVSLARKLGLKITAEGVESAEIFDDLRNLQCDDAQGYFISKPIAADQIAPFFDKWESEMPAEVGGPASRLRAVHGLLSEILVAAEDDDATIVLAAAPSAAAQGGRDIAAHIPALLLAGDWLGALAQVHRAHQAEPGGSELAGKLEALRSELERMVLTRELVVRDGELEFQLRAGDNFIVGRESATAGADIAVPCRWLSRGPKNLRLFHEDGAWRVCDLGSTNGHFHQGTRLLPDQPLALPPGETVLEIGKIGSQPAPAWLRFKVSGKGALELSYGTIEPDPVSDSRRWLLFCDEFSVGRDPEACLISPAADAAFAADVSSRNGGLWITPRAGRTVRIGPYEFSQVVPLPVGAEVQIGTLAWQTAEAFTSSTADPVKATA
jgi:EAL domain-containing protein (putative c-di-GMP-specific phosphodiesterase class I)